MWIKKFHKDDTEDLRCPIPTQVVSNEEYLILEMLIDSCTELLFKVKQNQVKYVD